MVEKALLVVGIARQLFLRRGPGLPEGTQGIVAVPANIADLAHQQQRSCAAAERILVKIAELLLRVVIERTRADHVERIKPSDWFEPVTQVSEHEFDQPISLVALEFGLHARLHRDPRQPAHHSRQRQ